MVQAVVWMAALGVLAIIAMVPTTVHLMTEILVTEEDETAVGAARTETSDSAPRQGHAGT